MIRASALLCILLLTACTLGQQGAFKLESYGKPSVAAFLPNDGLDDVADLDAAVSTWLSTGGTLVIPPGEYNLGSPWVIDIGQNRKNYRLEASGVELFSSHEGAALTVVGGKTPHRMTIEGLKVNHRGNAGASCGILLERTCHVRLVDCVVEAHGNQALYSAVLLRQSDPADGNTGCFWTLIDGLSVRVRSSVDGSRIPNGITLSGACNATNIRNCQINADVGVRFITTGATTTLANGVLVDGNHFEGVGTAVWTDGVVGGYGATGLRVTNNRTESATNFLKSTGSTLDGSLPAFAYGNFCVNGSVATYFDNQNNSRWSSLEPSYYGPSRTILYQEGDFAIKSYFGTFTAMTGTNKSVVIGSQTGGVGHSWSNGAIRFGSANWLWVDAAGKLRIKTASAPTSDTDGQLVGDQAP